jgi:hypothetical protein
MGLCWLGVTAGEKGPTQPAEGARPRSWAFTTPSRPAVPAVQNQAWVANPIDAFILTKLEAQGLTPSDQADKLSLLRRVTLDLTGLPPTLAEQEAFVADQTPDAYSSVVDRLLASPRYGERWAQHWLDLVRYAESDGFKADVHRPNAYKYRDYVIKALNADLPYDRFIQQQLAGDELEPGNPEALIATGFNRLWPDEDNAANLEQRRQEILDDMTEVTGLVFLGLTVGCARCHDHKFDPILQTDHYRLQAFFAPMLPRDLQVADSQQQQQYREQLAAWETATHDKRMEMEKLLEGKREEMRQYALTKFRQEIQQAVLTPAEKRTPYEQQIAAMAEQQLDRAEKDAPTKMTGAKKKRYQELEKELAAGPVKLPAPLPAVMAITDIGRQPPPTHLLAGGDWRKPQEELQPGFPLIFGPAVPDTRLDSPGDTTGRRAALARWLTRKDHPLTARVMANRLWQHHFGVGIVGTPNDFGTVGTPPTHPELLDWLAVEFVESGWSLKHLHRLMVTSATYQQSSLVNPDDPRHARAMEADPENQLVWHARRRRLEGEALRDAMLATSGELNLHMFGPSAKPKLPEGISKYAWKPDAKPADQNRRSIYVLAKRNMRYPLFDAFDWPDLHNSCAQRMTTTTAPQALMLLNGELTLERAQHWAARLLQSSASDNHTLIAEACRQAWGRPATADEIELGVQFLAKQAASLQDQGMQADTLKLPAGWPQDGDACRAAAVVDFCHAVLNSNEFMFVD